ncbi:hypothetical protein B0H17DRAFT_1138317 [Mycena rosella]|uniref:Uncharacterized protein n=1 Tax=Mycena rosella TaxID=1033263 RepID=A0AAD7GCD1_MYCRO|nr:hypothetical protein B0H17DRAFT_1138317 [Mycena rosella]
MVGRSFFLSPISPLYSPLQYPQQTVRSVVPAHPVHCSIHWAIHWHPDSRYSASPPCSALRLTAKRRPADTSFMLVDTSLVLAIYPPILQSLNPPSNPGDHQCLVSNVLSLFAPSSCGTSSFKSRVRKLISSVSLSLNSGRLRSPSRRCEFMQATSDYRELPDGYRAATDLPGRATRGYQSSGGSYQGLQTGGLGYLATKTTEATGRYISKSYAFGYSRSGAIHGTVPPPVEETADNTLAAKVETEAADWDNPPMRKASTHRGQTISTSWGSCPSGSNSAMEQGRETFQNHLRHFLGMASRTAFGRHSNRPTRGEGAWVFSGITYQKGSPARRSAAVWICAPTVRWLPSSFGIGSSASLFRRLPVSNSLPGSSLTSIKRQGKHYSLGLNEFSFLYCGPLPQENSGEIHHKLCQIPQQLLEGK